MFVEYSSENLRCYFIIILAQTLLAPELVLRSHGLQLITICDNLMSDMRSEGLVTLTRVIETFIRVSPVLGCETVKPILPRLFQYV